MRKNGFLKQNIKVPENVQENEPEVMMLWVES
jgi:hypothetical protein